MCKSLKSALTSFHIRIRASNSTTHTPPHEFPFKILNFPFFAMLIRYQSLDSEMSLKLDKIFGKENVFIRVQPGDVVMPRKYAEIADAIADFTVRPDDTWLVSYPRTGKRL